VLALTGYKTPDPVSVFYSNRGAGVHDLEMRDRVLVAEPDLSKLQRLEREEADSDGRADMVPSGGAHYRMAPGMAPPPPPPSPAASATAPMKAMNISAEVEKKK